MSGAAFGGSADEKRSGFSPMGVGYPHGGSDSATPCATRAVASPPITPVALSPQPVASPFFNTIAMRSDGERGSASE